MRKLWWRLLRLLRQSEIRLSAERVRFDALRSGDRVQIGSHLWRIERRLPDQASLELVAMEGVDEKTPARARLDFVEGDLICWWVLEVGGTRARLSPSDLLHFEVAGREGLASRAVPTS